VSPKMSAKILIAIITCHKFRNRADAQRGTWCQQVLGADVRFFLGAGGQAERPDEVLLDVSDVYLELPQKCRATFEWALDHGYDYVLKCDDDVYIQPDRLLQSDFQHDYVGRLSSSLNGAPKEPYASGFAHWVSRKAMEILVLSTIDDWAEDRWTGKVLSAADIRLLQDDRYVVINAIDKRNLPATGKDGPLRSNDYIAVCELEPPMMEQIHRQWMDS
jgi:Galactosyltransferase